MGDRPAAVLRRLQVRRHERLPGPVHRRLVVRQAVEVHRRPRRRRARRPGRVLGGHWAKAQGKGADVSATVAKAGEDGRLPALRHVRQVLQEDRNCIGPTTCAAGTGKDSLALPAVLVLRLGRRDRHRGGLGVAHRLQPHPRRLPEPAGGLRAQLQRATWSPSRRPGRRTGRKPAAGSSSSTAGCSPPRARIAGGATNSWDGPLRDAAGRHADVLRHVYDWQPVYHDPPSNQWFGFQAWSMERVAEYYHATGNAEAKAVLDKWVDLGDLQHHDQPGRHLPDPVRRCRGRARPTPGTRPARAPTPACTSPSPTTRNDVGVAAAYAKTLTLLRRQVR